MIRLKIAFALRLVDDFSGQCIRGRKFLFFSGGRVVHPVEKDEGLYIFLEPQEKKSRIRIEGGGYHSCNVMIESELLDPEEPVADVRMYECPGGEYSRSRGWLTGIISEPAAFPAEVYAEKNSPTGLAFREYRNIEGEHWVWFQGFTREKLTGKVFSLNSKGEDALFVLGEKRGINEYRIEPIVRLPDEVSPGTPLIRVYRSVTDRIGAYSIPVDAGEENIIGEVRILQHILPS